MIVGKDVSIFRDNNARTEAAYFAFSATTFRSFKEIEIGVILRSLYGLLGKNRDDSQLRSFGNVYNRIIKIAQIILSVACLAA
ncbi:MAG: hypothetical protein U5K69_01495 [Balneolaceae bacterium]|nr:hypothetical protein [Balneolaceae bacterium]